MKQIPVGRGKFALVDDEDYERLNKYSWRLTGGGYAICTATVYMHKLVRPSKRPMLTDHINRNRLDNRKNNLRVATYALNNWNKRYRKPGKQYIGTDKLPNGRFQARLVMKGRHTYLGMYKDEHMAALMYDFWVTFIRGEHAHTNFEVVSQWTKN